MKNTPHKINPPKFIKSSPYIIGVLLLTVAVLFVSNLKYLRQANIFSATKKQETASLPSQAGEHSVPTLAANTLSIPSLGIEAPLVYITGTTETDFQEALAEGVVHYPGTAQIGEPGNSYFFGHSSDLAWAKGKFKTVFEKLPDIKPGNNIYISNSAGKTFTYTTTKTFVVNPTETWVLDQGDKKRSILSLQTSYPVGTAKQRFVVQAELVGN